MRLFALETDIDKLKRPFLSADEQEIMTVYFHGFRFFIAFTANILWTLFLVGVLIVLGYARIPPLWLTTSGSVIWFFFIFIPIVKAFLDWRYDFILVTSDKVIVVDQSSFFHQKITPMNLENFASVSTETQFWNLFPFGMLRFNLKEGTGEGVDLPYIPHVHHVASKISDAITIFQRRKDLRRYGSGQEG
ncbi:hypothetical protein HYZ99_05360 [Candidatus Peregrinibacteria bacterium]|nr:hypothetical protein [Candidatus Peregrinibacteria bacterium]